MSITDELRKWNTGRLRPDHAAALDAIADRIDAEHEADVSTACRLAAGLDDDALAKRGYIALPVDADGVSIRVGDELEYGGNTETVTTLSLWNGGWNIGTEYGDFDGIRVKGYENELLDHPELFHHAQPDSWERIIEDAANYAIENIDKWRCKDVIALNEFIERCRRLAGDAE